MYNNKLLIKGYIDKDIPDDIDPVAEINRMRKEKNAVILAHYYQEGMIQDMADFVGDSLYLSQQAAKTKADMIVFCGVHFMAETAKLLCPERKVLLPDLNAGCSLADSCKAEDFATFLEKYPDHKVISYINTTAEIKALSYIICTSSNAVKIVESFDKKEKIIFAPDRNLGNYIKSITGRDMVIWDGACHVHEEFSVERMLELKKRYPDAKIIAHPECVKPVLLLADHIGSTSSLLHYTMKDDAKTYIVATESGIIHQMQKERPEKTFLAAPPKDSSCGCNDCRFMKLNTIEKLYNCMKYEMPEVIVKDDLKEKAVLSIRRMLDLSEKMGL
ncbi:MAG: quinolinate synthase NadA [Bacteroidales bacterium]|nr:quinolinate synthase NadA [Bacteroidales bacterium]